MKRLAIIGGCKIVAGLWRLVAADIALYALCVIEAKQ